MDAKDKAPSCPPMGVCHGMSAAQAIFDSYSLLFRKVGDVWNKFGVNSRYARKLLKSRRRCNVDIHRDPCLVRI